MTGRKFNWKVYLLTVTAFIVAMAVLLGLAFYFLGDVPQIASLKLKLGFGGGGATSTASADISSTAKPTAASGYAYATISAVGDILVHSPQLNGQYDPVTGLYDYNNNFKYVKKYIESADIAVANFETTLAGNTWRDYSGYPSFNSPDAIAVALKNAGFDMVTTATNHINDSGEEGFLRTVSTLRQLGLGVLGSRLDASEKNYSIREVNGIKIGFTNYGYETGVIGGRKSLNGVPMTEKMEGLLNTFDYENLDRDLDAIKNTLAAMKADGAEFIIIFAHWGNEYELYPNDWQQKIAASMADSGADVIIGGHPHVLQPIEAVTGTQTGRTALVAYSLGNFLSNQRYELVDNRYTEDGMIFDLVLKKDLSTGKITVDASGWLPTWVHKYFNEKGLPTYEIVPVPDAIADNAAYNLAASADAVWRVGNSLKNTQGVIASGKAQQVYQVLGYDEIRQVMAQVQAK